MGDKFTAEYFKEIDRRFHTAKNYDTVVAYRNLGFEYFSQAVYNMSKNLQFKEIAEHLKCSPSVVIKCASILKIKPYRPIYVKEPIKSYLDVDNRLLYAEDIKQALLEKVFSYNAIVIDSFKSGLPHEYGPLEGDKLNFASEMVDYLYRIGMSTRKIAMYAKCSFSTIQRILHLCKTPMRPKGGPNFKGIK